MKAYLIPGSGEDLQSRDYQAVLDAYEQCGYDAEFVPITWKYKTLDNWVAEVEASIPKMEIEHSLLSGFSFGSIIALSLAAKINPKKLCLYSLSPYFQEDFPLPASWVKWAGQRRIANFKQTSFNKLASNISCPTNLFIGSKEIDRYPNMERRTIDAHRAIKSSQLVIVPKAGHDVGAPAYVKAIETALNKNSAG